MSLVRRAALGAVGRTPASVRTWVYRHPKIWTPLARLIGRLVPAGESSVVQIRVGPNAGLKLAIDASTPRYYWLDPNYESAVVAALQDWLRPGMHVADIGAHIGWMTMLMARAVGGGGSVLAFEPNPNIAKQLRENLKLNELGQASVLEMALSDSSGEAEFHILPHSTTSHLVSERDAPSGATTIRVPLMRLDELIFRPESAAKLDVLKIDVEGGEAAVLRGAGRVLGELRPKVLIEVHNLGALEECRAVLESQRYEIAPVESVAESSFPFHIRCVAR